MQQTTRLLPVAVSSIPKPHMSTNIRCRPQPRTKLRPRGFASSAAAQAAMAQTRMPKDIGGKMPRQQSMKSMMKSVPVGELPNDFGFLPQTFVYGPSDYPSIFSDYKTRSKIEFWRIKQAFQGLFSYVASIRRLELLLTTSQDCLHVQMERAQGSHIRPESE